VLDESNATVLKLLHTVSTPDTMKGFRPIACSNLFYFFISKVLRRLNAVVPTLLLLSKCQNAFLQGRRLA